MKDIFDKTKMGQEDIEAELRGFRKHNKYYTWGITGLILAILLTGGWMFKQSRVRAISELPGATYGQYVSNVVNNKPGFTGGCCGGGFNDTSLTAGSGGCGLATGGGCGTGAALGTVDTDAIADEAIIFYAKEFNDNSEVQVVVTDFGCHIQADIFKGDQLIKSLGYAGNGDFYEI